MTADSLQEQVQELPWYHTLDLPGGVVTPGFVDGRGIPDQLPYPDLQGARCLDIGTMNGFWAYEMEKRGAAEVVALDLDDHAQLDWPARSRILDPQGRLSPRLAKDRSESIAAFHLARETLGSGVERRISTVYDLSPETFGTFDFVFVGSILLHLRDPVMALERVRAVCRGEALVFDAIDAAMTLRFRRRPVASLDATRVWWWTPNAAALRRWIEAAGWDVVERSAAIYVPLGSGAPKPRLRDALREGPNAVLAKVKGFPHVGWRIRPTGQQDPQA